MDLVEKITLIRQGKERMATDYFCGIQHISNTQLGVTSVLNLTLVRFDRRLDPFL